MTDNTSTTTLSIQGMHCAGCEQRIRTALQSLPNTTAATASAKAGTASITSTTPPDHDQLRAAIVSAGDYTVTDISQAKSQLTDTQPTPDDRPAPESLYPLFLIVGFILGVTLLIAANSGDWSTQPIMRHFMAGFFIVFAFFKLLDPPGFVSAYRGYDLLAKPFPLWAWAYPFIELALGVAYLLALAPIATNITTLILMLIGAAGVLNALRKKQAIRCACLGTALNLPMTKVTLVEDLTMAAMAAAMLIMLLS